MTFLFKNTQICRTCQENKPYSEFHVANRYKSGYNSECKKCKTVWQKERTKNIKLRLFTVDDDVLNKEEMCSYLGIGYSSAGIMQKKGLKYKKNRGRVFYQKKDIDLFMKSNDNTRSIS